MFLPYNALNDMAQQIIKRYRKQLKHPRSDIDIVELLKEECDLKFSEERFPNPKVNIARYNKDGFKISLSANSVVTDASISWQIWIFCSYAPMKKTVKILN